MYEYVQGVLDSLEPTQAVVDCGGVGYLMEISLNTYEALRRADASKVRLYVHLVVREDAHQLYGFAEVAEREMFRLLTSVSGVGNQTARMVLSTLTVEEVRAAVMGQDVSAMKRVKGVGAKTAQRVVLELADKIGGVGHGSTVLSAANPAPAEAQTALLMLGFPKAAVEKLIASSNWMNADGSPMSTEEIIKTGLSKL